MSNKIVVIDYGISNLLSVTRALEKCGANFVIAECGEDLSLADKIVLPGVGAFRDGMKGLRSGGFSRISK